VHDDPVGLVYNRARWLNAGLGRFMGRDPKQYVDSLTLFGYADCRPVSVVDPSGTDFGILEVAGLIAILAGLGGCSRSSPTPPPLCGKFIWARDKSFGTGKGWRVKFDPTGGTPCACAGKIILVQAISLGAAGNTGIDYPGRVGMGPDHDSAVKKIQGLTLRKGQYPGYAQGGGKANDDLDIFDEPDADADITLCAVCRIAGAADAPPLNCLSFSFNAATGVTKTVGKVQGIWSWNAKEGMIYTGNTSDVNNVWTAGQAKFDSLFPRN
jgi:RHS repeat-associated protein